MYTVRAMKRPTVIVIVGPTASGKSSYAVKLAKKIGGEVISADSRQVYKGLDIGTGKITKMEMQGVPHHMLDVADPKKVFTARDYVRLARPMLENIIKKGKTPIICGGTGFYIDALVGRITIPDVPINRKLRTKLEGKSAGELFKMLQKIDPRRAREIDRHNPVRLVRALEIVVKLGKVPHPHNLDGRLYYAYGVKSLPYDITWFGMKRPETSLTEKIHTRLLARMKAGMVQEAKRLHANGLSYKRMHQLGLEYRHLASLLRKKVTKDEMEKKLGHDIVKYAKRQLTYWKRNKEIKWIRP